ncbi:glucose-1-phosphate cytidylyltransferase [candidate division WOR-1 bacterium RIFOXYC2_FULL_37_10]|uniref:Glucose-1-phosphate cytidylyltransferase n=1 Tax=candidate division WOR-1 bacterium RIFOXYB2_FULL_37_13 TaxID=1802579 RepID=A0A1F4SQ39_UNCSA|nr:MAG: glucose-1-phosphate cytidylyltransferase [candidate division WOR-1 bacterium RIFOXYA2_FULL_37_7]OGC22568.1 MAG: glucose-1-phosphate cytidylyltransferase [candidate division WOR-1 bacterium RIFOXYB2_FULL_37_13]OGC33367.1 MAG: glucose-1-phosphate cytidylyltransferase [candidate division WOR-1 bacterium RIFOXYC2_FULL_37_10]
MKVVILCGGQGTRLREETEYRPKPLVPIGEMPILWHIMKTYSHYGYKNFILCLGYKGDMIKDYFLKFEELMNDFTLNLRSKEERVIHHNSSTLEDWNITFVNTGQLSQTGSRVAKIKDFIGSDKEFFLTYGDGLANVDISKLLEFHHEHGKTATITAVRPPSRFGEISSKDNKVLSFNEKPTVSEGHINGGFFVFKRELFDFLSTDDDCILEKKPLENLVKKEELMMYPHSDFWQCMDTYRDSVLLNEMWNKGNAPWKVWE